MSTPVSALRHLASRALRRPARCVVPQRRWARVHDVRFVATTQLPPAVLDKYRARLEQKARQEGIDGIDGLISAYAAKIDAVRKRDAVEPPAVHIPQAPDTPVSQPNRGPLPPTRPSKPPPANPPRQPPAPGTGKPPAVKSLGDILDLDKASALPEKELTAIWRLRHADSPSKICAVIPALTYRTMETAASRTPQFVLPVPHDQGAELHFLQWTFDAASSTSTVLFTHLAEYKSRGEFAQPHTTITHHLDLAAGKGLVLMQGQLMADRGIRPEHAEWLVVCLQRFYGAWDGSSDYVEQRRNLLEWFSKGDERFSVEKLLEAAERLG